MLVKIAISDILRAVRLIKGNIAENKRIVEISESIVFLFPKVSLPSGIKVDVTFSLSFIKKFKMKCIFFSGK